MSTDNSCKRKVASFPGCSHLQFLDRLQYAKMEGKGLGDKVTCVTSGRHEGRREGRAVPGKESRGPPCPDYNVRKDTVNTAHFLVDSRLINAKFVSYNDRALPPLRLSI